MYLIFCQFYLKLIILINLIILISKDAIVDSGSPVSLIRQNVVKNLSFSQGVDFPGLEGVNKSRIDILGTIVLDVTLLSLENVTMNIPLLFYVVSDTAIPYDCLLGRDFITQPNIKWCFIKEKVIIELLNNQEIVDSYEHHILNINYITESELRDPELDIEMTVSPELRHTVEQLFKDFYWNAEKNWGK